MMPRVPRGLAWQFCVLAVSVTLAGGMWLLATTGAVVGFALTVVGATVLTLLWLLRRRETKQAMWTVIQSCVAYVSGAWFWHRD